MYIGSISDTIWVEDFESQRELGQSAQWFARHRHFCGVTEDAQGM